MSGNGNKEQQTDRPLTNIDFGLVMGPGHEDPGKDFEELVAEIVSALLDPRIKTIRIRKNKIGLITGVKYLKK